MPEESDVVIVGGAAVGSAIAFFLTRCRAFDGTVTVVEKDSTYETSSTALSVASIRQQFSTPVNIRMLQFGFRFLRSLKEKFGPQVANFLFANGFSGLGLQQNPAVGRAVAEWIVFGRYQTLDLGDLGYHRIAENRPLKEANVI